MFKRLYPFYVFCALIGAYFLSACTIGIQNEALIMSKVVKIVDKDGGSCSGEQVRAPSGQDYVMTAAHCKSLGKDGVYKAVAENGGIHFLREVAEDSQSDLLLLSGLPGVEGLGIAAASYRHEHVSTYTHGRGMATYKTEGRLVEDRSVEVPIFATNSAELLTQCESQPKYKHVMIAEGIGICFLSVPMTFSTAFVAPGSSGGAVVNPRGELVGVVSASGEGFSLFVRLSDIRNFVNKY